MQRSLLDSAAIVSASAVLCAAFEKMNGKSDALPFLYEGNLAARSGRKG